MGRDTAADASRNLRLLDSAALRHHPDHGPTQRRAPSASPGAPLNLAIVDHLRQTVAEVADHIRKISPDPAPLPDSVGDLYAWYIDQTGDADLAQQRHRDTVIERHNLEHAIALGEYDAVRPHPCPACGTWGLMWDTGGKRALCTNQDCRTPDGLSTSWTLARLAAQKIRRTEIWRRNAT
ncbi:hypothetical protein [Streptomyces sp. NPDC001658]